MEATSSNLDIGTNPSERVRTSLLRGHTKQVCRCSWSPIDADLLLSGSNDNTIRLWNLSSTDAENEALPTVVENAMAVRAVDWKPDGSIFVSGFGEGSVGLFETRNGNSLWRQKKHKDWVRVIKFNPSGTFFATGGSDDETINVHDSSTGEVKRGYEEVHDYLIWDLDWLNDNVFASCGRDRFIKVWDVNEQIFIKKFDCFDFPETIKWNRGSGLLASVGSTEFDVKIWSISQDKARPTQTLTGHTKTAYSVDWSQTKPSQLASGSLDSSVRLWDIAEGALGIIGTHDTNMVFSVAFAPETNLLASSGSGGLVKIWDIRTRQPVVTYEVPEKPIVGQVIWNKRGDMLAACSGPYWLWCTKENPFLVTFDFRKPTKLEEAAFKT